jgi:hypothetical protein
MDDRGGRVRIRNCSINELDVILNGVSAGRVGGTSCADRYLPHTLEVLRSADIEPRGRAVFGRNSELMADFGPGKRYGPFRVCILGELVPLGSHLDLYLMERGLILSLDGIVLQHSWQNAEPAVLAQRLDRPLYGAQPWGG